MDFVNPDSMRILALIMSVISLKIFMDHSKKDYEGPYRQDAVYPSVSPLKHDMVKSVFVDMFPLLIYGLASNERFYDPNNFLGSVLGKSLVVSFAYFVFYVWFQPYVMTRVPNW